MKTITKTIYVSEDGKEFLNKTECEQHEISINETKELKAHIKKYCKNMCDTEDDGICGNVCVADQCLFYNASCECNCLFESLPYCDFD